MRSSRMNKKLSLALLSAATILTSTPLIAECRKVTQPGGAFGIDSGTLCSFGGDNAEIIPNYGYDYYQSEEEPLFSYKEQRAMLKSIARSGRSRSNGALQNSVNSASKPLGGTSRRIPFVVFGGGGR